MAGLLPRTRRLYWRIRQDWTLISFGVYGSALFVLVLTFDDYVHEGPYALAALVLLALGGWLYLRSAYRWQRALCLLGGLTLCMAVAAAGKAILFARVDWAYPSSHWTWQTEAVSTAITWGWLTLALLIPGVLGLLPGDGRVEGWRAG